MSYYSELSIDTRTCGEADEDARLDARDGYRAYTREGVFAGLEAQRAATQLNSRPALTPKQRALNLHAAMMAAKQAGEIEKARALAVELKPLLGWLS